MSLFDYLDELRAKPESHRLRIAISSAAVITGVIFFVWITTLAVRFSTSGEVTGAPERNSSPFKTLQEQLGAVTESAYSQFEQIRESLGSIEYKIDESSQKLPE